MTDTIILVAIVLAVAWLWLIFRYSTLAVSLLLLWIPVQGWFQLNVFNDSSATVLIYEFLIIGIYLVFAFHAMRFPSFGPPRVMWFAVPFTVWALLLTPSSIELNGAVLTAMGLRTYLLPLPLVWIGYCAFTTRRQIENLGWLLMLQMVLIAGITAVQYIGITEILDRLVDAPVGFANVGVLRPPGTFSAPGHLGMYILFSALFGFGLLGLKVGVWKRLGFVAGLAGTMAALVINTQRATMVLLMVVVPLMILHGRGRRSRSTTVIALAVIVAGGIAGSRVSGDAFVRRVESIASDANFTLVVAPRERLADAMRTPVVGGGLGIAVPGVGRFLARHFSRVTNENLSVKPAESFMAAIVYQTGVPGLLLFYLFIGAIMFHGLHAVRACRGTEFGLFAAAIFSFEVAICLQSWTYDPLHFPPSRVLFWFWAGVLLSLPRFAATVAVQEPAPMSRVAPVGTRRLVRPPRPSERQPSVA